MRIEPKSAGAYSAGAFLFLLVFGLGWPGPGTWLLVFALAFLAAAAAAWWLDDALVASTAGGAVPVRQAAGPFAVNARGSDAPRRRPERGGRSVLLTLGLPGHDSNGRWVLPDRVHVTVVAGLVGVLAMIIFIGGALGGGGSSAGPAAPASQPSTALDFAQPVTPVLSPQLPTAEQTITPVPATVTPSPIVVETPESSRPLPAQPLDQPTTSTEPAQVVIHDVVAGDTIYDLAIAFETSIDAIMNANGISEFDTIRVGDRLIIPAGGA
jgi:hypothetical protein